MASSSAEVRRPGIRPGRGQATLSGLAPRTAACLAYSLWWVSGGLMLALEPDELFVRFHARQAIRVFGLVTLVALAWWMLSFVLVFFWPFGYRAAAVLAQLSWMAGVVAWLVCLWKAWRRERWVMPWIGPRLGLR